MIAPKRKPVDPISKGHLGAIEVQSIQIGVMTASVPPGSLEVLGAVVAAIWIIVLIIGRKPHIAEMKSNFM